MRITVVWICTFILAAIAPITHAAEEKTVVVYTSVDRIFSEPVLKEAGKRLNLKVIGVYDTEETKSTGLVNRLIAKKGNPDGDVFWSGDPARAAMLKSKGVTAAYESPEAKSIPETFKDSQRHWIGFSARTRVLLVNTKLVPAGKEPKSIFDLTKPEWKGRVAIANPLFGTTSFHVAAVFHVLGEQRGRQWLDDLKANGVQIVSSNGEVKRQVAAGQVAVGLTDSDDAAEAIKDGQPVRTVPLDQEPEKGRSDEATKENKPLGTLVIPNTVSLIKGGPNADDAKRVFDFLLTSEVQRMLAESCAQAPLTSGVTVPRGVVSLDRIVPMRVDYGASAEQFERLMPALKEWVERK